MCVLSGEGRGTICVCLTDDYDRAPLSSHDEGARFLRVCAMVRFVVWANHVRGRRQGVEGMKRRKERGGHGQRRSTNKCKEKYMKRCRHLVESRDNPGACVPRGLIPSPCCRPPKNAAMRKNHVTRHPPAMELPNHSLKFTEVVRPRGTKGSSSERL